ncbi:hypothetical protein D3C77_578930 [compost metagenome]
MNARGHLGGRLAVSLNSFQKAGIDVVDRKLALVTELANLSRTLPGCGGYSVNNGRHCRLNRLPTINLYLAGLQRLGVRVERGASLVGCRSIGHQQETETVGDIERLLGTEAQATHHIRRADIQLLSLSQRPVSLLGCL